MLQALHNIIGYLLLSLGVLITLRQLWNWTLTNFRGYALDALSWSVQLGHAVMGILYILVGFYILHW